MSEPFVAEIRIFPYSFAPRGWSFCSGQIMAISQNTALFSLIGTFYGGNGSTTFGLPNLGGRMPRHPSDSGGVGEQGGSETVTLATIEMPAHSHSFVARNVPSAGFSVQSPANAFVTSAPIRAFNNSAPNTTLAAPAVGPAGGNLPHNNMPPFLALNFCIAMQGIFPARP